MNKNLMYCPICGNIVVGIEGDSCSGCGFGYISTGLSGDKYYQLDQEQREKLEKHLFESKIEKGILFSREAYEKRRSPLHESIDSRNPGKVVCPLCGSSQIQLIQQKWSIATGFLTNKVDRVCVNCKHKF